MANEDLDKLDRLAAEKIMGFTLTKSGFVSHGKHLGLWQPTRNIVQAWKLLEKLGFNYAVSKQPIDGCKTYGCLIADWTDDYDVSVIEEPADTAELAITKACLKASGVEID